MSPSFDRNSGAAAEPLVEDVPNFSEGRNFALIASIRDVIAAVPDARALDVSSDAWHNRSVIAFVAPRDSAAEAAFAAVPVASERVDVSTHHGVHPRLGATDVMPFVPLDGTAMHDCISLAHQLGERVALERLTYDYGTGDCALASWPMAVR